MCAAPRELLIRRTQLRQSVTLKRSGFFLDCGAQWASCFVWCVCFCFLFFIAGTVWRTFSWGIVLLCLKGSTEHCCSHPERRTRAELLTWSFQHTIISMCNACVDMCVFECACAMQHEVVGTGKATVTVGYVLRTGSFMTIKSLPPTALSFPSLNSVWCIILLLTGAFWRTGSIPHHWQVIAEHRITTTLQGCIDAFNNHISSLQETFTKAVWAHVSWVWICTWHGGLQYLTERPLKHVSILQSLYAVW